MISLAKATLRYRWASFVGAFLALALGTAMIGMMALTLTATFKTPFPGPQRYAHAQEAVVPAGLEGSVLPPPAALPTSLVSELSKTGAEPDRSFLAQAASGGSAMVGHGWPAASFAGYRLVAGHAPGTDDEIVLGGGSPSLIGTSVPVTTPTGTRDYLVTGVTNPVWFENAVFFIDAEAALLSPPINALVYPGPGPAPSTIAAKVGSRALVLTGDNLAQADPDDSGGTSEPADAQGMAGTTMGLALCVSVFVVVATFAFAVEQRRRELALLRLIGATPKQIRRMVMAEASLIGLVASTVGCLIAPLGTGLLRTWMVDHSVAPSWFGIGLNPLPLLVAFAVGMLAALLGSASVLVRVSLIRPVETMRESAVERRALTPVRLLLGVGMLAGAAIAGIAIAKTTPYYAAKPRKYESVPVFYTLSLALLSPILLRPVTALLTRPLARIKGAAGPLLVRQNILTSQRRTAAAVAPIVVAVGLVGTMLTVFFSGDSALLAQQQQDIQAAAVVVPGPATGIDPRTAARIEAVPGARATPVTDLDIYLIAPDGSELDSFDAYAVPTASMGTTVTPRVEQGAITRLGNNFLVIDDETASDDGLNVGDKCVALLPTGARVTLTIAAIIPRSPAGDVAYLSAAHAASLPPNQIYLDPATATANGSQRTLDPTTLDSTTLAAVQSAAHGSPAQVLPYSTYLAAEKAAGDKQANQAAVIILGVALAYSLIAVGNTLVMAVSGRRREFAVLALSGALRAQILRMAAAEAAVVVVTGAILAATATALTAFTQHFALTQIAARTSASLPSAAVGGTIAACALVAIGSVCVATWRATRQRAIQAANIQD